MPEQGWDNRIFFGQPTHGTNSGIVRPLTDIETSDLSIRLDNGRVHFRVFKENLEMDLPIIQFFGQVCLTYIETLKQRNCTCAILKNMGLQMLGIVWKNYGHFYKIVWTQYPKHPTQIPHGAGAVGSGGGVLGLFFKLFRKCAGFSKITFRAPAVFSGLFQRHSPGSPKRNMWLNIVSTKMYCLWCPFM